MKNKKQFLGVLISILICVFVFSVIVYATTTIGTNISAGGTLSGTNFSTNETLYNTFVGYGIETTTTGSHNVLIGYEAGKYMDDGEADCNVGIGAYTLYYNTGLDNTAVGANALSYNTTGSLNVALGAYALGVNISGDYNVAIGYDAMQLSTTGDKNTAVGNYALNWNETGSYNVAIGYSAMEGAWPVSTNNTAVGYYAGQGNNSTGYNSSNNSLFGYKAGLNIRTGSNNVLLGYQAGDALTYGSNNIVIGYDIDTLSATADNYMNIGGLIFGDLSTASAKYLGILDSSPAYTLSVDGTASVSETAYFSGVVSVSDANGFQIGGGATLLTGPTSQSAACVTGSLYVNTTLGNISICDASGDWTPLTPQ